MAIGEILYNEEEINRLYELLNDRNISKKDEKMIKEVIRYYSSNKCRISYASVYQMKTISKLLVSKTLFKKYDYLPMLRCDDEILSKLDEAIVKEYTKK